MDSGKNRPNSSESLVIHAGFFPKRLFFAQERDTTHFTLGAALRSGIGLRTPKLFNVSSERFTYQVGTCAVLGLSDIVNLLKQAWWQSHENFLRHSARTLRLCKWRGESITKRILIERPPVTNRLTKVRFEDNTIYTQECVFRRATTRIITLAARN